jgi:hypothetical protein
LLFNSFETLRLLSTSCTPQLLVALVVCGTALFVSGRTALDAVAFAAERMVVIALVAPLAGLALTSLSWVAWAAMLLMMALSVLRLYLCRRRTMMPAPIAWPRPPLIVRALVAATAIWASQALVERAQFLRLPTGVVWATSWLLVSALLRWLLWRNPEHAGWSGVILSDAGRMLYALWQPDVWVWGLWSICDVVVLLVALYLSDPQETACSKPATGDGK